MGRRSPGFEEEVEHYERALQVLDLDTERNTELRCELLVRLADARALARDPDGARRSAMLAVELAREIGSAEHLGRAALAYGAGWVVVEMGRVDATIVGLLEEAIGELSKSSERSSRELLVRVGARLAQELYFGGDFPRIEALLDDVSSIAEELSDPGLRSTALRARVFNLSSDKVGEALAMGQEIEQQARQAGDLMLESSGLLYQVSSALLRGDRPALLETLEREERLASKTRLPFVNALPLFHRTTQLALEGRWAEFRPMLSEGMHRLAGGPSTNARQWGGMLQYVAGRHLGRLRVTEESTRWVERFPHYPVYRAYLAAILAGTGELEQARAHYEILVRDDFGSQWRDFNRITTLALIADVTVLLEDRERAAALYEELLPWQGWHAAGGAGMSYLGPFDQRLGMLSNLLGESEQAIDHLESAVEATRSFGARPFEAESRFHLASALAGEGPARDPEAARSQLERTLEIARPLAMAPIAANAEALLGELATRDG